MSAGCRRRPYLRGLPIVESKRHGSISSRSIQRHSAEFRETYLDIYEAAEGEDRLITSIEVLSAANKTAGDRNRALYLEKQREMLDSRVNLVALDLQKAFSRAYDTGPYRRLIGYVEGPPAPPLEASRARWAAAWLKEHVELR